MKSKRLAMIIAIVLAVLLILPFLIEAITALGLITQDDIDALKDKASALASQRKQIEQELNQVLADKSSAMQVKQKLDEQIDVTEQEIENAEFLLEELNNQLEARTAELANLREQESSAYELFKKRVRACEEAGEASYIGVLLQADSLEDMLGRLDAISEVMEYDKCLMQDLKDVREQVEIAEQGVREDKLLQEQTITGLAQRRDELSAQCAQQESLINELEDEADTYRDAYDEAEAAQEKLQQEIIKMIADMAKQNPYVGGEYAWPAPGYYTITSPFGMRYHPILKVNKLHTGIDIAAPKGTKVVAANAGTVVTAGYNTGYGNYVVINHGGNQATLYAHLSKISVGVNQVVKREQQIGLVGSTGYSTGNHLHFEIIIDGKQVDPEKYFNKQ